MASSPSASKKKSLTHKKIINYCQNNLNTKITNLNSNNLYVSSRKENKTFDEILFSKSKKYQNNSKNETINSKNASDKLISLKNDYLIKNKDTKGIIDYNLMSNPLISPKIKDKFHDLISNGPYSPSDLCYLNLVSSRKYKEIFQKKQQEIISLITDNGKKYKTFSSQKNESHFDDNPNKVKISRMTKFIEKTISSPRRYTTSFKIGFDKYLGDKNKKQLIQQIEKEEIDSYIMDLSNSKGRKKAHSKKSHIFTIDNSNHSKTKSEFLATFFE